VAAPALALDEKTEETVTRSHRRSHLRIWVVLAVLMTAVFVAGLAARRTATPANSGLVWERLR
jgi:hypothetical protein